MDEESIDIIPAGLEQAPGSAGDAPDHFSFASRAWNRGSPRSGS